MGNDELDNAGGLRRFDSLSNCPGTNFIRATSEVTNELLSKISLVGNDESEKAHVHQGCCNQLG